MISGCKYLQAIRIWGQRGREFFKLKSNSGQKSSSFKQFVSKIVQEIRIRFLNIISLSFKTNGAGCIFEQMKSYRLLETQQLLAGVPPLLSSRSASLKTNSDIEVVLLTCCDFASMLLSDSRAVTVVSETLLHCERI